MTHFDQQFNKGPLPKDLPVFKLGDRIISPNESVYIVAKYWEGEEFTREDGSKMHYMPCIDAAKEDDLLKDDPTFLVGLRAAGCKLTPFYPGDREKIISRVKELALKRYKHLVQETSRLVVNAEDILGKAERTHKRMKKGEKELLDYFESI